MNLKKHIIFGSAKNLPIKRNWLKVSASAENCTVEISIDGTIGSDYCDCYGECTCDNASNTVDSIAKQCKGLQKGNTVCVDINSLGGDLIVGVGIHDTLAKCPATVTTDIIAPCASAATIVAMAGSVRKMSSNALFLIHRSSTGSYGNLNELNVALEDLKKFDALQANIYSKATGKTVEEIFVLMDANNGNGKWLNASEALDFGFITEVYEPSSVNATFDTKVFAQYGLPTAPENKIKSQKSDTMKKEQIVAAVIAGIKGLLPGKDTDTAIDAKITTAAETAAIALKTTFDASLVDATAVVKSEIEAANKVIVDAKDAEIVALKADKQTAIEATAAVQVELDKANGKETPAAGKSDPEAHAGKSKLTGLDKKYAASAAALRGDSFTADEDEEDEA